MKLISKQDIIESGLFRRTTSNCFEVDIYSHHKCSEDSDIYQFKVIRDLIIKEKTLFFNMAEFKLEAIMYSLKKLNCYEHHKIDCPFASSLLDFLVLNKDGIAKFGDKDLAKKLKPIVDEALNEPKYYEILHELLLWALYDTKATQFLLDCGLNPNYQDCLGLSPLMLATNTGVIKALLKAGADINLTLQKEVHTMPYYLGVNCVSDKYKALFGKNAYEIHSILGHVSVIKLLDSTLSNSTNLAHGEHFTQEYEKLKKNMTTDALIKAMKNDNSVVFEHLEEFSSIFYNEKKTLNLALFAIQLNKPHWLEKMIQHSDKETLMSYLKWGQENTYLDSCLYQSQYKCAQILLQYGICDIHDYNYDKVMSHVYDKDLNQKLYELMPEKMTYHYALQACNIELLTDMMKIQSCDDVTFNNFCVVLQDRMNNNDYKNHIYISNMKMTIVDSLATLVLLEKNEHLKEKRLNTLVKAATSVTHNYRSEEFEKKMKSKAQRILKYFPEKRNEVMANLAIHFPEMVINLEEKALKKMIQMPKNNKMKHLIKQSQQSMKDEINDNKEKLVIQLKRNKI